ncbi:MAG: hypothetical protein H8E64_03420 [Candidatus Marinimicrobia bacterium]|nr:hypothetical protein [Candidatus Neomarinimicrobiota bacterium]
MAETQIKEKLLHGGLIGTIGAIQFVIFSALAMVFYTGGTAWNHNAVGYTFWLNMFSDLGRTVSYSGEINTVSSIIFNFALTLFGASLFAFYFALPTTIHRNRSLIATFRIIGFVSAAGMILIGVSPDDILSEFHMIGVWVWAIPLFIVSVLTAYSGLRVKKRYGLLSVGLALLVGVHIGQGLADMWGPIIPITQKIVVYYNVIWILYLNHR